MPAAGELALGIAALQRDLGRRLTSGGLTAEARRCRYEIQRPSALRMRAR
jgi:hypothetical protein